MRPPNICLFLADDHGWDIAGCYGNPVIRTPNIDRLAAGGMRFTRAFAGSPTCSPSRAILYTGLHSARNGLIIAARRAPFSTRACTRRATA